MHDPIPMSIPPMSMPPMDEELVLMAPDEEPVGVMDMPVFMPVLVAILMPVMSAMPVFMSMVVVETDTGNRER